MPASTHNFPFDQPVKDVKQKDRSPKHTFVLGVYASAVHATWKDANGKLLVRAMAVASEPEIFWNGDQSQAAKIINRIKVPVFAGTLQPAAPQYNGPSGKVLDEMILKPLGYTRDQVWLCDCIPYSRMNPLQARAIKYHYAPLVAQGLHEATIPKVERSIDDTRRAQILAELEESGARCIVLLGDLPMKWFLSHYASGWTNLAGFVKQHGYGTEVEAKIGRRSYDVLLLVHPRWSGWLALG